jgi:hypothetical protein
MAAVGVALAIPHRWAMEKRDKVIQEAVVMLVLVVMVVAVLEQLE